MRATQIQIHNFRSIIDITINVRELSLLAGANNSGKSNIIDAIRIFYGDLKWIDKIDSPKVPTTDKESWIEIEFKPSTTELSQLKEEYKTKEDTFRVRNYLHSETKDLDNKVRSGYYAYVDEKLSETLFYGAKNVGSGKVGKIVYIPAVSKIDEHTKFSGPSALRDLVATVLSKVMAGSQAYADLATAFTSFETGIKAEQTDDGKSVQQLEQEISDELAPWETNFTLEIQNIQPDDLIKSLVKPLLVDQTHGGDIDQARFGAGFQRNLIYVLLKLAAKYAASGKLKTAAKKEFSPDMTWILFEEPEAFLHPSQEDILYESLLTLSEDEQTQILLTTHSSRFVARSISNLTRLIRLRRDKAITTSYQITPSDLDGYFDASQAMDDEIKPASIDPATVKKDAMMSALKMELWLQPQRAAAFFSKLTILVEGASEVGLYSYLADRKLINNSDPKVTVIDCMGKFNIHRFILLLNAFGVDHSVMYDGDDGNSKDTEVTAAINKAKGTFTKQIKRFDKDLETELGITPLSRNESSRKPQYILYCLESGLVSKDDLDKFVTLLSALCV